MTGMMDSFSTPATARMPNIAIIGMEGAGKTVLTTTLAKRLSIIDSRGVFLNPQGVKMLKYVEGVWHTLQSGEWPPSTPPGELFELKWKFQVVGELECDVRLIDTAGQDLRLLFGDEQILSGEPLPGNLQALADYCRSADIILYLINLQDFIGQSDLNMRTANEAAIKAAMDYLGNSERQRRVCLIFSQTDLYRDLAHERGGWLELAAEAIPYVFGSHVRVREVATYPVSAVADTQVVVDPDGTPRRVPTEGFHSEGFDELITWLTTQVRDVKQEFDQEAKAAALVSHPPTLPVDQHLSPQPPKTTRWGGVVSAIVAVGIATSLLRGCVTGCNGDKPTSPVPVFVSKWYQDDPGTFDDGITIWGTVRNDGIAGDIRVIALVTENDAEVERQHLDFYLEPGQATAFRFQMNKIIDVKNKHKASIWAEVP